MLLIKCNDIELVLMWVLCVRMLLRGHGLHILCDGDVNVASMCVCVCQGCGLYIL